MTSDQEGTPLDRLTRAVQDFAHETGPEGGALVMAFVVVFERTRFDSEGDQLHELDYATAGGGMAASLGLVHAGQRLIERDTISDMIGDDE